MKSYVSMESNQCPICLSLHDTGALLLDKRLKNSMESTTVTGHSICSECQKHLDQDLIAFVEVSNTTNAEMLKDSEAKRTGRYAWVSKNALPDIPDSPMLFCDIKVMDILEQRSDEKVLN